MSAIDTDNTDTVAGSTDFEYRVTPTDAMLVEASAPVALTTFTISGPDTVIFEINKFTGEVTLQDWFAPEPGDNWDADENGTYNFTVTTTAPDGTVTDTPASLTVTPTGEYIFDAPAPIVLPEPEPVDPDPVPFGTLFSLSGDDAIVLQIDETTGAITLNDWLTPDPGDNWDADEDGIYDFNIVTTAPDGTVVTTAATLTQDTEGTFMVNAPTIDILPEDTGPVDPPVTGTELITNGLLEGGVAFENNDSDGDVDGWATSSGTVDVWGDGFFGVNTPDGGNFIQVDTGADGSIDTVYQDVRTLEDDQMELEFSAAQRFGESESLEVYYRDELIDTVTPTSSEEWDTYTYTVTGSGGLDRLEFRELASESDGSGPFVDNVSLISASPDAPALALRPNLTEDVLDSPGLPTRPTAEPEPEGVPGLALVATDAGGTLTGTAGDDTLSGGAGTDVLNGLAGNDVFVASAGPDTVDGGAGADVYDINRSVLSVNDINVDLAEGNAGATTLLNVESVFGGSGANLLSGNAQDNLLSGGDGDDTLFGLDGDDVLIGGLGNDTHVGAQGDDILTMNEVANFFVGGLGEDALVINSSTLESSAFAIDLAAGTDQYGNTYNTIENIDGGLGDDNFAGTDDANVLIGRAGDDTLSGRLGGDVLNRSAGYDVHNGGGGEDLLIASAGADTFNGGAGIDTYDIDISDDYEADYGVNLATGVDNLGNSYSGIENVNGGWGDDSLTGDAGINILDGGVGDDVVMGGAGDDSLAGGLVNDVLDGGDDNDVLFGSFGVDTYEGGAGVDTFDIGGSTAGEADYNIDLTVGQDQYGDTYSNIENVTTGSGDDNLFGNAADNQLQGNDGDDTIDGAAGNDFHNGGNGDDVFLANAGSNSYFGGNGVDTLQIVGTTEDAVSYSINLAEGIDDQGNTNFGVENVNAGSGNDRLVGNFDDNALYGGVGDDTLTGGGGDDTLTGGLGDDVFTMGNDAGSIEVTDFTQGADQIDLSNITGVEDFDDLAAFLLSGGGTSTLTFDITEVDQLQLIIQAEEDLEASDFIF